MSSPQETRGFTDLLTGATHLLDLPANALFKYTVKNRLPPVFLPSFLHEATHFWCMSTDLGAALALLEMRAQREVTHRQHQRKRLLHDVGAAAAIHRILRPLLE